MLASTAMVIVSSSPFSKWRTSCVRSFRQYAQRLEIDTPPDGSQFEPVAGAVEQLRSGLELQRLESLANRRLGSVESLGGRLD